MKIELKMKLWVFLNTCITDFDFIGEECSIREDFPSVDPLVMTSLDSHVSHQEVRDALFEMAPLKAPRIDGLHAQFYQTHWSVVRDSLVSMIQNGFERGEVELYLNKTLIVLISKVVGPELVSHFRPISLCTVPINFLLKLLLID